MNINNIQYPNFFEHIGKSKEEVQSESQVVPNTQPAETQSEVKESKEEVTESTEEPKKEEQKDPVNVVELH